VVATARWRRSDTSARRGRRSAARRWWWTADNCYSVDDPHGLFDDNSSVDNLWNSNSRVTWLFLVNDLCLVDILWHSLVNGMANWNFGDVFLFDGNYDGNWHLDWNLHWDMDRNAFLDENGHSLDHGVGDILLAVDWGRDWVFVIQLLIDANGLLLVAGCNGPRAGATAIAEGIELASTDIAVFKLSIWRTIWCSVWRSVWRSLWRSSKPFTNFFIASFLSFFFKINDLSYKESVRLPLVVNSISEVFPQGLERNDDVIIIGIN
jgi:hypothetical protein